MNLSLFFMLAAAAGISGADCHNQDPDMSMNTPKDEVGAVFAMTNTAPDNKIIAFSRNAKGELKHVGEHSTGGIGQGVDFDTQGGLVLNHDHSFLYAVSPVSDLVSVFSVKGSSLQKVQEIYAGDQPLSFTISKNGYAYALDGSVASTGIFGFKVDDTKGTLTPLTNKTIPLSSPIGVPGDISFSPDGKALIAVNKVGSTIDVFAIDENGQASETPMNTVASSGIRPFAATFNNGSSLYVIESGLPALKNTALSTYRLNGGDTPSLTAVTKSERNDQTDGCWIVVTPDEKYAYAANFISGTISSYGLASNGTASLLEADAAMPDGLASNPVDLVLSADGRFLYNLLRGSGAVAGYEIQDDGSLKQVGELAKEGIPPKLGASGLAGY